LFVQFDLGDLPEETGTGLLQLFSQCPDYKDVVAFGWACS
jgi:hypothetical protein